MQLDTSAVRGADDAIWSLPTQNTSWTPSPSNTTSDISFEAYTNDTLELDEMRVTGLGAGDEQVGQARDIEPEADPELSSNSISSVFNVDSLDADGNAPDFDLVTSDGVHFAVNAAKLRTHSFDDFGGKVSSLAATAIIPLSSAVLNLLLHAVYGISVIRFAPTLDDLATAVDALEHYGLSKMALMYLPQSPLFEAIFQHAVHQPLQCYSLAAHEGLEQLAIAVSPHTLQVSLTEITDDDAVYMGPSHLRRLFFLHLGRMDALKRILQQRPKPHPPTESCNGYTDLSFSGIWVRKVADIVWEDCPNISPISLETRLGEAGKGIVCDDCLWQINHHIQTLIVEWSLVKNTI